MSAGADAHPVQEHAFTSIRHPGPRNAATLFGSEVVRPLGACMIPIMLGALSYMLTGLDPLRWLTLGFPLAMAVASTWTVFQLRRRVAEVQVRGEAVRVRSAWQVAANLPEDWVSPLDVRRTSAGLVLTLGHDSRLLVADDWPNLSRVEAAVVAAADSFRGRVQSRLDS